MTSNQFKGIDLDAALASYVETALWSSTDFDGNPLDGDYSQDDISAECLAEMISDLGDFIALILGHYPEIMDDHEITQIAHDFWLTRNGHGAGFWDGDYPEHGDWLTDMSKPYGSVDLYVGDDGIIYAQ